MRFLNKIIFINSASVNYAEIELDGNVHLIGTQGVGKSTLLRAILFFYNANKTKLGIPREKKGFDSYYFEFQNSYIIYEIVKEVTKFCVLAYKVNGKVAFRFFDSAYKKELFLDENNRAYQSWEYIRNAFGKNIHYSSIISSYEEYRKIIYGDNKGLKPDFKKYALIESKQYQNIPRTIQNVLLNANLEAKFIKDTIINSLNDDEFKIDIENYSKNHLRDFESQINDIKIWFKKNKKGQIIVRKQAEKVIDKYRHFNYSKREKKDLSHELALRLNFIEKQKPIFTSNLKAEAQVLNELFKTKEHLEQLHKNREQDLVSKIYSIHEKLKTAKTKLSDYESKNIDKLIIEVAQKDSLINEKKNLEDEKNLLTFKFTEIRQKYEALVAQIKNQQQSFYNDMKSNINDIKAEFGNKKASCIENCNSLINKIKEDYKEQKEQVTNEIRHISEIENGFKRRRAELKYKTFFAEKIDQYKEDIKLLNDKIVAAITDLKNAKNKIETTRKEWQLEEKDVERDMNLKKDTAKGKQQKFLVKIDKIENKIKQSENSLYGWLNDNLPNWEQGIGKVIDQDDVLFNSDLNPKLIDSNSLTMFGIDLDLNVLETKVKTVKEYKEEIEDYKNEILKIQDDVSALNKEKQTTLQKLKLKFKKKINELNETIAQNEYAIAQTEIKLRNNKIALDDWINKSKIEKQKQLTQLEYKLEENADKKLKAQERLENIKKSISRRISLKETERDKEIQALELKMNAKIQEIEQLIAVNQLKSTKRIAQFNQQKTDELKNKGADTKRLNEIDERLSEIAVKLSYISDKEIDVIEYNKDKRELFDKVPQLKADKKRLENKQAIILDEHMAERNKISKKYAEQDKIVQSIKGQIDEFVNDLKAYEEFKKSKVFTSIQKDLSDVNKSESVSKTAIKIISEINDKHYEGIQTFKELQQAANAFIGNFDEQNIFRFKVKLSEDSDYLDFAVNLKEFVEEDKISHFESRVNQRFAHIIQLIGRETKELNSKEAEIEKIIKKINEDFVTKNFVQAIKEMEMRKLDSSNPVVKLLNEIREFNNENSLLLGETNLFTTSDSDSKNQKAVELLKQLVKELEKYKNSSLTLSESFDLQFRIVENDNDSGWVEKLSNVGSEGTDVLVKAMINILLLNVFKDSASKKNKDFKIHCMMDEIGRLHPNNVKGILQFANERNILLINGSPTSQSATDYKYTYKLAKEQSKNNPKKYITRINRLIKVNPKVLN